MVYKDTDLRGWIEIVVLQDVNGDLHGARAVWSINMYRLLSS